MSKKAEQEKALRQQRRSSGLCIRCGMPAIAGRAKCERHSRYANEQSKLFRQRRMGSGTCMQCGNAGLPAFAKASVSLCETCYLKKQAHRHLGETAKWMVILKILENQNWKCAYTGDQLVLGVNDSLDHIFPKFTHPLLAEDPSNLEWTTRAVNIMKRAMSPDQFLEIVRRIASYRTGIGQLTQPVAA